MFPLICKLFLVMRTPVGRTAPLFQTTELTSTGLKMALQTTACGGGERRGEPLLLAVLPNGSRLLIP